MVYVWWGMFLWIVCGLGICCVGVCGLEWNEMWALALIDDNNDACAKGHGDDGLG